MGKIKRLNIQGLARSDRGLMVNLIPEPGNTIISCDLASGEPTVTTHFSRDANYRAATFDMVGKVPYYKNGMLYIDDIYLMVMSTSPLSCGASLMRETFERKFDGKSFQDKWLEPGGAEYIQKVVLKKPRKLHKGLSLGLGYGMQPKKLIKTAYESGEVISMRDSRGFFRSYWDTFPDVRRFADRLAAKVQAEGRIINNFGYRLVPEPHKAFNHFIQSSVSGIIDILGAKVDTQAPYAEFLGLIHDELLYEVPTPRVDEFRHDMASATDSLNDDLKWSVRMRTGFVTGANWFEAK